MTYALSAPLQAAVFARLAGDADLSAVVGGAIYDTLPSGAVPSLYVAIGEERVRPASDATVSGAWHDIEIAVVTDAAGFAQAKRAAGAISDALLGAPLTLARGRMVGLWFRGAKARRIGSGTARRVDLRFRARVDDDL